MDRAGSTRNIEKVLMEPQWVLWVKPFRQLQFKVEPSERVPHGKWFLLSAELMEAYVVLVYIFICKSVSTHLASTHGKQLIKFYHNSLISRVLSWNEEWKF